MSGAERATLLAVHQALTEEQFQSLKFLLEQRVPPGVLAPASRPDLCRLLLQRFPGRALRLVARLLRQIHRHDLVRLHRLPEGDEDDDDDEAGAGASPLDKTPTVAPGSASASSSSSSSTGAGSSPLDKTPTVAPGSASASSSSSSSSASAGSSPLDKTTEAAGAGSSPLNEPPTVAPGSASASSSSSSSSSAPGGAGRLSERELLRVARRLGGEWREVGIACLGLPSSRLEQIGEEEPRSPVMRSFAALRDWQRRERQAATAARLQACLAPACLDPGVFDLLRELQEG